MLSYCIGLTGMRLREPLGLNSEFSGTFRLQLNAVLLFVLAAAQCSRRDVEHLGKQLAP
jgi:hypothetical protein